MQFKNYTEAGFTFIPEVNFIGGNNGIGKTNILDAIYYLSIGKSYLNPADTLNIQFGADFFLLKGNFVKEAENYAVQCAVKKGQKKQLKLNNKPYERLADHVGAFPLVMASPDDVSLIWDGSDVRRKFIDGIIAQVNHTYLDNLLQYNKALYQRNALLKHIAETRTFDTASLEVWNAQLCLYGKPILAERLAFVEEFTPFFQSFYTRISGGNENVSLTYQSTWQHISPEEALAQSVSRDRALGYTSSGIHKDELLFLQNNLPIKKFASQGQQKTYLLALRLAQCIYIGQKSGISPILLLDDVYDKLDETRLGFLLQCITEQHTGQLFITDTHHLRIPEVLLSMNINVHTILL